MNYFKQRYENFDLMTMRSGELIELLKSEIEKDDYDIEYIKEIIEWGHFDIDYMWFEGKKKNQSSFLMKASYLGKSDIVKTLLDGGANPNLKNRRGLTALMKAAENGKVEAIEEILRCSDTDPNLQSRWGQTALIIASYYRHTQAVQELLKHPKTNPNLQSNDGFIAIMWATRWGNLQAVQELLSHPAIDITITNNDDETAWDMAKSYVHLKFPELNPNRQ